MSRNTNGTDDTENRHEITDAPTAGDVSRRAVLAGLASAPIGAGAVGIAAGETPDSDANPGSDAPETGVFMDREDELGRFPLSASVDVEVPEAVLEVARAKAGAMDADLDEILLDYTSLSFTFRDERGEVLDEL